jgi:hypothetical protein
MFDVLAAWADSGNYRGCAFLNAVTECPNDLAVRAAAVAHKDAIEAWLRALLSSRADAALDAAMLMVLYDGALARALIYRTGAPMRDARAAAALLFECSGRASPPEPRRAHVGRSQRG